MPQPYRPDIAPVVPAKRACELLKHPEVQDIVQSHRDDALRGTEDFDVVEELIGLYRMSVTSGNLAVAHNTLATLGRLQNLEPARRVEVHNLCSAEIDRQNIHYLDVIGNGQHNRPAERDTARELKLTLASCGLREKPLQSRVLDGLNPL